MNILYLSRSCSQAFRHGFPTSFVFRRVFDCYDPMVNETLVAYPPWLTPDTHQVLQCGAPQ